MCGQNEAEMGERGKKWEAESLLVLESGKRRVGVAKILRVKCNRELGVSDRVLATTASPLYKVPRTDYRTRRKEKGDVAGATIEGINSPRGKILLAGTRGGHRPPGIGPESTIFNTDFRRWNCYLEVLRLDPWRRRLLQPPLLLPAVTRFSSLLASESAAENRYW